MTLCCPRCRRSYKDPARFHRHMIEELRAVEEEFRALVLSSKLKLEEVRLLSNLTAQEVRIHERR